MINEEIIEVAACLECMCLLRSPRVIPKCLTGAYLVLVIDGEEERRPIFVHEHALGEATQEIEFDYQPFPLEDDMENSHRLSDWNYVDKVEIDKAA